MNFLYYITYRGLSYVRGHNADTQPSLVSDFFAFIFFFNFITLCFLYKLTGLDISGVSEFVILGFVVLSYLVIRIIFRMYYVNTRHHEQILEKHKRHEQSKLFSLAGIVYTVISFIFFFFVIAKMSGYGKHGSHMSVLKGIQ